MTMATDSARERLKPAEPAGEGLEWAPVEEDPRVWAPAEDGATCRGQGPRPEGGGRPHAHGAPAQVRTRRGVGRRVWWNYCAPEHSYGRWAEDGKVWRWAKRPAGT
jgi:hypothetical protein